MGLILKKNLRSTFPNKGDKNTVLSAHHRCRYESRFIVFSIIFPHHTLFGLLLAQGFLPHHFFILKTDPVLCHCS